jgi:hypothetical protein
MSYFGIVPNENPAVDPSYVPGELPPGAAEYLRPTNPRLLELRARYAAFRPFRRPQWPVVSFEHELELAYFRGDNAYSWQVRGGITEMQYVLTAYYVQTADRLGLFDRLTEDHLFGSYSFDFNGRRVVSRDLLDSILQINFIERMTGLSQIPSATVLDIGAGYGRLAHRMSKGLPNLKRIWCADAVPESTFLCEYYLKFRGADERVQVLELDRVEAALSGQEIDVVTNVQSFTESAVESIAWWMDLLDRCPVKYLLIVPNTPDQLLSMETDRSRLDFQPLIERHGYRLIARESIYENAPSVQKFGVYGDGKMWMFRKDA